MIMPNPSNDQYRPQLDDRRLNDIIDYVFEKPDLEKRVYYSHMWRRYDDQIRSRVEERASIMEDKVRANRWKNEVYKRLDGYRKGVPGYEFEERTATLKTNANHHSLRLSRNTAFSGTFESASRAKRIAGYIASALVVGFVLYSCWVLKKALPEMIEMFNPPETTIEQMIEIK